MIKCAAQQIKIAGILNITPDSFSDGGRFLDPTCALKQAAKLIEDGADIIDVGAESTAPMATGITHDVEWSRLAPALPEIVKLARDANVEVSVDTRYAATAKKALQLGVDYINDQSGLADPDMISTIAGSKAKIIVMHSFELPVSGVQKELPHPDVLVSQVIDWLQIRVEDLKRNGISEDRIIIDPGLGFGKPPAYSWHMVKYVKKFFALGLKVYIGHSRKRMFSAIDVDLPDRDVPTAMVSMFLALSGVHFVRVHDVAMNVIARKVAAQLAEL